MEERHDAEHDVVDARMDDLLDRLDVGADVVMREHDGLGHAGRAGGEDDREQIVAADFVEAEDAIEQRGGRGIGAERAGELVAARDDSRAGLRGRRTWRRACL